MKTNFFILAGCLCIFSAAGQTRYHVNQTKGDDGNNGQTWTRAFATLQRALDEVKAGDEIWVAEGIYLPSKKTIDADSEGQPTSDRYKTFIVPAGVKLYGGFPAQTVDNTGMDKRDWELYRTVLSGDLAKNDGSDFSNMDDNAYCVVYLLNTGKSTVIDGFTVSGGNYDPAWVWMQTVRGSGIVAESNAHSSPTLQNLIIEHNVSRAGGAGFSNNALGEACPVITNTIIRNNISGEYGGGFANAGREKSAPVIENVIISGNQAVAGGGMFCFSDDNEVSPVFTNVLIHGNLAELIVGGALLYSYNGNIKPVFTNVTITGNKAEGFSGNDGKVGGLLCESELGISSPAIRNSVIAGNKETAIFLQPHKDLTRTGDFLNEGATGSWADIQFSIVETALPNAFVRAIDADYAPTSEGDYRPDKGSPLINKGNNDFVTVAVDLSGKPRIFDTTVDIGAYEYQELSTTSIGILASEKNIWVEGGNVYINIERQAAVRIYSVDGLLVRQAQLPAGVTAISLPQGIYFVSLNNESATKVFVAK